MGSGANTENGAVVSAVVEGRCGAAVGTGTFVSSGADTLVEVCGSAGVNR